MKFNISKYILLGLIAILVSCEKEYEEPARVTYFANFEMEGELSIIHTLDEPYTDGAVTATEDGVSLEVKTLVRGEMTGYSGAEVDVTTADKYTITYSATNSDGYDGSITRTVFVAPANGDLVNDISGFYKADVQRAPAFAKTDQYTGMQYIYIVKTGDNTYSLSDAVGGYYYIGRGYGYDYAAQGAIITANDIPGNDFSVSQAQFPVWGNTVNVSDFAVDPATSSVSFTGVGNFGNGTFRVQLYQVK